MSVLGTRMWSTIDTYEYRYSAYIVPDVTPTDDICLVDRYHQSALWQEYTMS